MFGEVPVFRVLKRGGIYLPEVEKTRCFPKPPLLLRKAHVTRLGQSDVSASKTDRVLGGQ